MRAGPLSHANVIRTLNAQFVPVYLSNQLGGRGGSNSPEELAIQAEVLDRFRREGLPVGSVWVYILSPDGEAVESMHVAEAVRDDQLHELLQRNALRFDSVPSGPLIEAHAGAIAPARPTGGVLLHLASRGWEKGSWRQFPAESWIPLDATEVRELVGGGPATAGAEWVIAPRVSEKILTHFYPATEDPTAAAQDRNEIALQQLKLRVLSVEDDRVMARLDGALQMDRAFYPGRNASALEARVTGYIEFDATRQHVSRLRLVARAAEYGDEMFDVALREHGG